MNKLLLNHHHSPSLKTLLLATLLVGTLDILTACIDYWISTANSPEVVLQYIASGIFGPEAFAGGIAMNIWGLFFHYIISLSFTFLFFSLYMKWKFIRNYPVSVAISYAIFMWAITTKVVVPLSKVPDSSINPSLWEIIKSIAILLVMICLPLTLIMRRHYRNSLLAR